MTDAAPEKTSGGRGVDPGRPDPRESEPAAHTDGREQHHGCRRACSVPQIAGEDSVAIGDGRYAHFRRDRRFAQVQVAFTAPEGVDPNPGRELTGQFKEQGWTWRPNEPGKPWVYQLEQSSEHDPSARGDSRDALHEQFLIIVQEYRVKHGLPPTFGWESIAGSDTKGRDAEGGGGVSSSSVSDRAGGTGEDKMPQSAQRETRAGAALGVLDAFASVGADRFDLTFTDLAGAKVAFRGNQSLNRLRAAMPGILAHAEARRRNVIVRPRSAAATLIQLDDLDEAAAERLRPVSFLALRTSPGNYQAWVGVADADADFARRLRKGAGADLTASGATRLSGSLNFKDRYAPAFPRVETVHTSPGKVVKRAELEDLGVVAPDERVTAPTVSAARPAGARGWPSYRRCVDNAPKARGGGRPDVSRADFTFCLLAIDWGWGVEEAAERLFQESRKARENGEAYALRTARSAGAAIERRRGRRR